MKRILTIAFTLIYFITSSGVLVGQHLCMGRVKDAALFKKVEKDCGMDMPVDMEDCCDDEWSFEIIEDDQQASYQLMAPVATFFVLYEISLNDIVVSEASESKRLFHTDQGPPDKGETALYLFYQSLKIPAALQS